MILTKSDILAVAEAKQDTELHDVFGPGDQVSIQLVGHPDDVRSLKGTLLSLNQRGVLVMANRSNQQPNTDLLLVPWQSVVWIQAFPGTGQ